MDIEQNAHKTNATNESSDDSEEEQEQEEEDEEGKIIFNQSMKYIIYSS
jgi:hypothetical protein